MDELIATQRLQFDILDLLRSVRGFDSPDGVAVVPNDVMEKVEEELERLYGVEAAAVSVLNAISGDTVPTTEHATVQDLLKFFVYAEPPSEAREG